MSWFILFLAGILEAVWLVGIQKSESFTKIPFVILAVFAMTLSLVLFSLSLKNISPSQAYMVWLAVGIVSISLINHVFFAIYLSGRDIFFMALIFVGVLGLKMSN